MYNDFKFKNYKQTNHKIRRLRELVNRLYGDYEYKKKLISEINLKLKINFPSGANLPDLIITDITSIDRGHYFEFTITIKNIGEVATTEETNLVTTILDQEVELVVPTLDVDETVDRYTSFPYDPNAVDTYSLNVNSEVNEERNIEESDYSNNILDKNFEIKENYNYGGLIVHGHTPEGIELGSLVIDWYAWPRLTLDGEWWGWSPRNEEEHNCLTGVLPGPHQAKISYNGIEMIQNFISIENKVTILYFTFERHTTPVIKHESQNWYYYLAKYDEDTWFLGQSIPTCEWYSLYGDDYICMEFGIDPYITPSVISAATIPFDLYNEGVRG